ncbi:MAG TPA: hypothetical protein VJG64_00570 [Candidatus Paceibacterota bacterium]
MLVIKQILAEIKSPNASAIRPIGPGEVLFGLFVAVAMLLAILAAAGKL